MHEPCLDELSDVAYALGRLLGHVTGRGYVHVPGDARHVAKIRERYRSYGCIRSHRHLVEGRCASA